MRGERPAHRLRAQLVELAARHVLRSREDLEPARAAADEDLRIAVGGDLFDEAHIDAEPHLGKEREDLLLREQPRIAQRAVGAPDAVLEMLLHVERERLARATLVRDDLRHGALEVVDDLLLAEAERELVRDLEEVAYDLLVVAVERAQRETELLRDIDDVVDVARIDEPRQVEYDRCAQARAEVCRTRCEIAHLLVEREVELSFDGVIDSGSEGIGLLVSRLSFLTCNFLLHSLCMVLFPRHDQSKALH